MSISVGKGQQHLADNHKVTLSWLRIMYLYTHSVTHYRQQLELSPAFIYNEKVVFLIMLQDPWPSETNSIMALSNICLR